MDTVSSEGKIIIFSAPSGSGKSTIIRTLKERGGVDFCFSVSATNREPREGEINGRDYYFLSNNEFRSRIENDEFIEYCEVYPGRFYGTLKSEVGNRCSEGDNIVLDVDVEGGMNVKKLYGGKALSIFIMPPSIEALSRRLENRGTDSPEKIKERLKRAAYEISLAEKYDVVVENDSLEKAVMECEQIIKDFISDK